MPPLLLLRRILRPPAPPQRADAPDTSGSYALLVRSEERHAEVVRAFRQLVDGARDLRTTSYVIVETVTLLQHRIGLPAVRDLVEHVLPIVSVEWVADALHQRGVNTLLREDRRRLSLVDCVSFEFMRAQGLREALTLDVHFDNAGFRTLPGVRR